MHVAAACVYGEELLHRQEPETSNARACFDPAASRTHHAMPAHMLSVYLVRIALEAGRELEREPFFTV